MVLCFKMCLFIWLSLLILTYIKVLLSPLLYRLKNRGIERLNVKDIEEVISQVRCWKDYCFKSNQEGCEEGWETYRLTNTACCAPTLRMDRNYHDLRQFILGKAT